MALSTADLMRIGKMDGPTFADMMEVGFDSRNPDTWKSLRDKRTIEMAVAPFTVIEDEKSVEKLVEELNERIIAASNHTAKFMLNAPQSVTVMTKTGNYSKRPLIGGEEFRPTGCYLGKRKGIIYTFKPVDISDYTVLEMDEATAKSQLDGFERFLKSIIDLEFERVKREVMDKASLDKERAKLAEHAEQYADMGFGSW